MEDREFIGLVWEHYRQHGRSFAWRQDTRPYQVLVSELMLQQTQTARVAGVFPGFIEEFPDLRALAEAPLARVLAAWQGLGYNRRARFLKQSAEIIILDFAGQLPADEASLRSLPGIGPNTAASILAFAYNLPTVFIETNIRTVFLHHHFPDTSAGDREILPLVARTLDTARPREWYWALMDYGVHLKRTVGNASRRSPHHVVQGRFAGSVRQVRGEILRVLLAAGPLDARSLQSRVNDQLPGLDEARYRQARTGLLADGLVSETASGYRLAE
jgi:A/G-specific adenine glycosylase